MSTEEKQRQTIYTADHLANDIYQGAGWMAKWLKLGFLCMADFLITLFFLCLGWGLILLLAFGTAALITLIDAPHWLSILSVSFYGILALALAVYLIRSFEKRHHSKTPISN